MQRDRVSMTATSTFDPTSEPSVTISSQRPSSVGATTDTRLQSPCPNDPFWDYYSVIGDISRVNGKELVRVANWIGADQVIKIFLQNWLTNKIRPLDLPNVSISTPFHRAKWDQFHQKMMRSHHKNSHSRHNIQNSSSYSGPKNANTNGNNHTNKDSKHSKHSKTSNNNNNNNSNQANHTENKPNMNRTNSEPEGSKALSPINNEETHEPSKHDLSDLTQTNINNLNGSDKSKTHTSNATPTLTPPNRMDGMKNKHSGGNSSGSGSTSNSTHHRNTSQSNSLQVDGSQMERANSTHSILSEDSQDQFGFVLHSQSVLNLVKQCIKQTHNVPANSYSHNGHNMDVMGHSGGGANSTSVESRFDTERSDMMMSHPNAFELPGMSSKRKNLSVGAQRFRAEFEKQAKKQHSRMRTAVEQRLNFGAFAVFDLYDEESWVDFRNSVGCIILSCLDQQSFIAASLVCRAWFYCSRFGFARSHIRYAFLSCLFVFCLVCGFRSLLISFRVCFVCFCIVFRSFHPKKKKQKTTTRRPHKKKVYKNDNPYQIMT